VKPYVNVFRLSNSPLPLLGHEHPIPYKHIYIYNIYMTVCVAYSYLPTYIWLCVLLIAIYRVSYYYYILLNNKLPLTRTYGCLHTCGQMLIRVFPLHDVANAGSWYIDQLMYCLRYLGCCTCAHNTIPYLYMYVLKHAKCFIYSIPHQRCIIPFGKKSNF
jgi:hypothetical protein